MQNNTASLKCEIKTTLRTINYPLLIVGCLFISSLGTLMVLGHNPELINAGFERHVGFTLSMFGIITPLLLGMVIGGVTAEFYSPRVLRYVKAPDEIEMVKDWLINLGSYVTTIDNTINPKKMASVFLHIAKELKKIPVIESDLKALKNDRKKHEQERKEWQEKERTYLNQNVRLVRHLANEKGKNKKLESENIQNQQELKKYQSEIQRISSDHEVTKQRLHELEKKLREFFK